MSKIAAELAKDVKLQPFHFVPDEEIDRVRASLLGMLKQTTDNITSPQDFFEGKDVVMRGMYPEYRHWFKRKIESYGGTVRRSIKNYVDILIFDNEYIHPTDLTNAHLLQKANRNFIIIEFSCFNKSFVHDFDEEYEKKLIQQEIEINRKKKEQEEEEREKKVQEEQFSIINASVDDLILSQEVFRVEGRILLTTRDRHYNEVKLTTKKDIYDFIEEYGGKVQKKGFCNVTCVVCGTKVSPDQKVKYTSGTKFISVEDLVDWLQGDMDCDPRCRGFNLIYNPTFDEKLRPYQQDAKVQIFNAWNSWYSVMLQMPTGTGKTMLFTSLINDLKKNADCRILIVAHRSELIEQIDNNLNRYNIEHGIIASGTIRDLNKQVQVASVQTLTHRANTELMATLKPDFIIIDEAHHSLATTYTSFWKAYPKVHKLGVTATPYRLNGASFESHFETLISTLQVQEFIKNGYLSNYKFYADNPKSSLSKAVDSIRGKSTTGDYKVSDLLNSLNVADHIQHLVHCYLKYAKDLKGIVYAISVEHANEICKAYQAIGIETAFIDSKTPSRQRKQIIEDFKANKIRIMVNVDIFSEGFDCPDIEFVQLARPSYSLAKYLQQVGRALRITENKKEAIILDNARMYSKFGLPSENRNWQDDFSGDVLLRDFYKEAREKFTDYLWKKASRTKDLMVQINSNDIAHSTNSLMEIGTENDNFTTKALIIVIALILTIVIALFFMPILLLGVFASIPLISKKL